MRFNPQLYQRLRPDLLANWQSAQAGGGGATGDWIRQFGSLDAYLQQDYGNDPTGNDQRLAQFQPDLQSTANPFSPDIRPTRAYENSPVDEDGGGLPNPDDSKIGVPPDDPFRIPIPDPNSAFGGIVGGNTTPAGGGPAGAGSGTGEPDDRFDNGDSYGGYPWTGGGGGFINFGGGFGGGIGGGVAAGGGGVVQGRPDTTQNQGIVGPVSAGPTGSGARLPTIGLGGSAPVPDDRVSGPVGPPSIGGGLPTVGGLGAIRPGGSLTLPVNNDPNTVGNGVGPMATGTVGPTASPGLPQTARPIDPSWNPVYGLIGLGAVSGAIRGGGGGGIGSGAGVGVPQPMSPTPSDRVSGPVVGPTVPGAPTQTLPTVPGLGPIRQAPDLSRPSPSVETPTTTTGAPLLPPIFTAPPPSGGAAPPVIAGPTGSTTPPPQTPPATVPPTPVSGSGRNLANELNQILPAINPFAVQNFNTQQQLNPQLTQLNTANFNSSVSGLGNLQQAYNQANPGLAQYTQGLQGYVNNFQNNLPGSVATAQYAPAQSQMGGPGYNPVAGTQIANPFAPQAVSAPGVNANTDFSRVNPNTGFNGVQSQTNDLGLMSAANQLVNGGGPSSLQQTLEQQAAQGLSLGTGLSAEDLRNAQQSAREAWSARGLVNSNGAIGAEILNRDSLGRQRLAERQALAQQVNATGFGQRQQGFTNALGLSSAAQGYAGLGLQAQQSNLGAQLAGNQLGYQGQLANQNAGLQANQLGLQGQIANQGANLQGQLANQQAGLSFNNQMFNTGQANQQNALAAALANQQSGLNYANLATANNQFNAGAGNVANQFNAGAQNTMGQFNANLGLQGQQNLFNNALAYGNFQQQQAQNPFGIAQQLVGQTPDYTSPLLAYGQDAFNTNFNQQQASQISQANNQAAQQASLLNLVAQLGGAYQSTKTTFLCVPEGERVDTPEGSRRIEEIRAGDKVIGYRGESVDVQMKHEYQENPGAMRFFRFTLDNGRHFAVCDNHRIEGIRAKDWNVGDTMGAHNTITHITRFDGVHRSYDLVTPDGGYRMAAVKVNSMVEELALTAAKVAAEKLKHAEAI